MKRFLTHGLPIGLGLILAIILLTNFGVTTVGGRSMNPTLADGDLLLVSFTATPKDGDMIILDTSDMEGWNNSSTQIVKRYYAEYSTDGYYVLGDNPDHSYDSRHFGEIDKDRLVGVVVCDLSNTDALGFVTAIITGIFH